ncbi:MAG: hypothetical protein QM396_06740 [Euryarchaeota archaeon]|jgi:uncharacterized protein with PQ loop repeat|uniref:hypothetical protein n=1 Tax=Methanobacterium sp. MZD130B TaxID=3394378 RepID=UPI001761E96F|nr:hypothetical protein [Euryarchaeota archaeon]HHT18032.1 hypothetical protein [Methanobacterium sp.]
MYLTAGMIVIVIGWIIQFYKTVIQKDPNINLYFLVLYVIGVISLVIGNILINDLTIALLNLFGAILPLLILIMIKK